MKEFLINGESAALPVPTDAKFGSLLESLHQDLNRDSTLISAIRVNGKEIGLSEEQELSQVSIRELESVEVFTSAPQALARETLTTLLQFTDQLSEMSSLAAKHTETTEAIESQRSLIGGVQTLVETVEATKAILGTHSVQEIQLLEADLLSILQDLLEAEQRNDMLYRMNLLNDHLPRNLKEWKTVGIPALLDASRE